MGLFSLYSSPFWILPCLLFSLGLSYLLYRKSDIENILIKRVLFLLRFLCLFCLCLLLLNPIVNYLERIVIKPKVVLLLDNSESIRLTSQEKKRLFSNITDLKSDLESKGNEVLLHTLDNTIINHIDSISFDHQYTDISNSLNRVWKELEDKNLQSVILFSDGIQNKGMNPLLKNFYFPIHTVGLGDTNVKKDVVLQKIASNKVVQPSSEFPLDLYFKYEGFVGDNIEVEVIKGNQQVYSKVLSTSSSNFSKERLYLKAPKKEGVYEYEVVLKTKEGEYSITNNRKKLVFEVVKKDHSILIAAAAPHPDVRALKAILSEDERNDVDVFIASKGDQITSKKHQLVIFYQLPDKNKIADKEFKRLLKTANSLFFIVSSNTDINLLNRVNSCIRIDTKINRVDKITPLINSNFNLFFLENKSVYSDLPPLTIPFGEYFLKSGSSSVLHQKIGSVETKRPLLSMNLSRTIPTAVMVGEGVWSWRTLSYEEKSEEFLLDELLLKVTQLLTIQSKKDRFIFQPKKKIFSQADKIYFDASIYNALYEPVDKGVVDISISKQGVLIENKQIVLGLEEVSFESLPPGRYQYKAKFEQSDTLFQKVGSFLVEELNIELFNMQANHSLLQELAVKSKASFYPFSNMGDLSDNVVTQAQLKVEEDMVSVIKYKWIFFVLLSLITIEWTIRKLENTI